jgi:hypothetical protein
MDQPQPFQHCQQRRTDHCTPCPTHRRPSWPHMLGRGTNAKAP